MAFVPAKTYIRARDKSPYSVSEKLERHEDRKEGKSLFTFLDKKVKEAAEDSARRRNNPEQLSYSDNLYYIGRIPVTGGDQYGFDVIMSNLDLTLNDLNRKRVISVGEGYSQFVPEVRWVAQSVIGVDTWYSNTDMDSRLSVYVSENRDHLVTAEATNIPLPSQSADLIVMHQSLLYMKDREAAVREALRLLAPSGEIRIFEGCASGHCFNTNEVSGIGVRLGLSVQEKIKAAYLSNGRHMSGTVVILRRNSPKIKKSRP